MIIRIVATVALLSASSAAFAQDAQPQPLFSVQQIPPGQLLPPRGPGMFDWQSHRDATLTDLAQRRSVVASPARVSRAQRLAELINNGRCAEAHAVAADAYDARLARRVSEVCSQAN